MPREYSVRKTFLYNQYTALLKRDTPVLFLTHSNLSAKQLIKLRRDIAGAKPSTTTPERSTLTLVNTGLLGAALRAHPALGPASKRALARLVTPGALAALTLPPLDPPHLAALLRVLDRAAPSPLQQQQQEPQGAGVVENATPGRRPKRVRAAVRGTMEVRGALLAGRLVGAEELRERVARLPTLGALRAQIVGLLGAPAARLAGVVGEAAGGRVAGTLEGFRRGLEVDAGGQA